MANEGRESREWARSDIKGDFEAKPDGARVVVAFGFGAGAMRMVVPHEDAERMGWGLLMAATEARQNEEAKGREG